MRHSLSLFVLGVFAAALLMIPPTPPRLAEWRAPCTPAGANAMSAVSNWLGSLHGWPDSALVMNWRAMVAASKGRVAPPGCG